MKKVFFIILLIAVVTCVVVFAMGDGDATTSKEKAYTSQLMAQSLAESGMPSITEFSERKLAKLIYEKRDDSNLICYVYTQNLNGEFSYLGRSMGYGLPYSTQYTAPTVDEYVQNGGVVTRHQADPNGLYTPEGLSATWLLMINEDNGDTYIMYVEPTIVVSEHKLPRRIITEKSLVGIDYDNL